MPTRTACAAALAVLLSFAAPAPAADGDAPLKKSKKADATKADTTKAEARKADPAPAKDAQEAVVADPPLLHVGDEVPLLFNGLLHNAKEAGLEHVDLRSLVGPDADDPGSKVVLLSFFATWCGPCKKELPFLVQLSHEYKERGLRVISVAIDKDEAKWPEILELVAKHKVDYPVVKDRYNLIARQYLGDKTPLPSVFLIGRDGLVKLVKQGYPKDAAEFLKGEVEKAIGGAQ